MRVRHRMAMAVHRFFDENGFYWIHTPIITASDAEGAGEMFRVSTLDFANAPRDDSGGVDWSQDFFGRKTGLTVSGQLNVETYCLAMSRVYTFGPTFRAENSDTARHLAEFWMIEPEIAFADLSDNADLAEDFLRYIYTAVLEECQADMAFFDERIHKGVVERLEGFVQNSFERISYTDAIAALEKSNRKFDYPVKWGIDLQTGLRLQARHGHVVRAARHLGVAVGAVGGLQAVGCGGQPLLQRALVGAVGEHVVDGFLRRRGGAGGGAAPAGNERQCPCNEASAHLRSLLGVPTHLPSEIHVNT